MSLETTRFGAIDFTPEQVITLTQPIIGFPEYRRFIVLPGPPDSGLYWLQSTESGSLAFLMMNPRLVVPEYKITLSAHELTELAAHSSDELEVYTLLVVPADKTQVRTNLRAPVLLNRKLRLGKQTILEKSDYPIQYFLAQGAQDAHAQEEAGHARTHA
jgi:flagellar assembly factor FliW